MAKKIMIIKTILNVLAEISDLLISFIEKNENIFKNNKTNILAQEERHDDSNNRATV